MKTSTHGKIGMAFIAVIALFPLIASAQLITTVSPVKIEGDKAVVKLGFKNDLTNSVESARASVWLLNSENKTVAQATHWVIGGSKDKPPLAVGATNAYYFVLTSDKPFSVTNLSAKVNFNRVVLQGGKLADVEKYVRIQR